MIDFLIVTHLRLPSTSGKTGNGVPTETRPAKSGAELDEMLSSNSL